MATREKEKRNNEKIESTGFSDEFNVMLRVVVKLNRTTMGFITG